VLMDPESVFSGGPVSLAPGGPSPVGLGDVVARVTAFVGLHPCDSCRKRRHWLNRVKVWGRWGWPVVTGFTVVVLAAGAALTRWVF